MRVRAIYDYDRVEDTELTLKEGEVYEILSKEDEWWQARNSSGQTGLVPSNYVELIDGEDCPKSEKDRIETMFEQELQAESKTCGYCEQLIQGSYVVGNGKNYHEDCFTCGKCEIKLSGVPYIIKDNKNYCEKCFNEKYSPKCSFCNEIIQGKYIKALEKDWHSDHFNCSDCGEKFTEKYLVKENLPYCEDCFNNNFLPKCNVCEKHLEKEYYNIAGQKIHKECFKCATDGKKLSVTDLFKINESKIYCPDHYNEMFGKVCGKCQKSIKGKYVGVDKKFFHDECWACAHCGESLAMKRFLRRGSNEFICTKHEKDADSKSTSSYDTSSESGKGAQKNKTREDKNLNDKTRKDKNQKDEEKITLIEGDESQAKTLAEVQEEITQKIPYEDLKGKWCEKHKFIDFKRREQYLSDEMFKTLFKMDKEEFYKLTFWKQRELKKKLNLF